MEYALFIAGYVVISFITAWLLEWKVGTFYKEWGLAAIAGFCWPVVAPISLMGAVVKCMSEWHDKV